ncbi:MAG: DUF3471 domain-containing protein [Acidobacteriia bacterium]|nr:DUF3471 domain-containing protein [Terriglobia bacterium]
MVLITPDRRAGIVVLMNSDAAGAAGIASQLLEIALGVPPESQREITVDPKLYEGYIGSYQMNDFRMTFVREHDGLSAQIRDQTIPVFPQGIHDFFFKAFNAQLTFVTDGGGRATELILHEGGIDTYLARTK